MKTFGIYLAYGPRVNMRGEGLGRHLAEFLKASAEFSDVRFIIAAPAWLKNPLSDLFEDFGIDPTAIDIVSPRRQSIISVLYHSVTYITERRRKIKKTLAGRGRIKKAFASIASAMKNTAVRVVQSRNPLTFVISAGVFIAIAPIAVAACLIAIGLFALTRLVRKMNLGRRLVSFNKYMNISAHMKRVSHKAYRLMCDIEASAVANLATAQGDVAAWYSPASFWPEFNSINRPRVMCVPDAVPVHFSVSFATDGSNPERGIPDFRRLEDAIENGNRFVTYSEDVKERTLVRHFNVDPLRISVVRHGANRLDHLVNVSGFTNDDEATDVLSAVHLWSAFSKSMNNSNAPWYASKDAGFLFYASQIRPNKNVLTLLKAYSHLKTVKGLPYKLVLTGDINQSADVKTLMDKSDLHDDVLFVRGLSEKELASCYRLASLSINPSLAEGGMPFTFTESVSVGTPVIMADIPVTREILVDERVAAATLFDPFDFRALAAKIESALDQKNELLVLQSDFYSRHLVGRSYRDVVEETVAILEAASADWNGRTLQS